ncbi:MAG TPA: hypothetical protein VFM88_23570 [Vicinamibacteria bacterium]|nr:hypothetical protein [Vicinamibacteria bacterium]
MGRIALEWGAVCAALIATPVGVRAQDVAAEAVPFRVRMPYIETAQAVRRVLGAADGRLARSTCQEVLTDFRDGSTRTLKDALDANGVSARDYLRWILFVQDRGSRACKVKGTVAVTEPGSRVVFICPRAFLEMAQTDPERAEATVIHEMLHSLGLGENPPSSKEITERVLRRCAP